MSYSPEEIKTNLKKGDVQVYRHLFREYYMPLVAYSRKFVIDMEVARDLVQEVFCYLWDKRETIRIDRSVESYLFRAAHNACLNHLKRDEHKNNHAADLLMRLNDEVGRSSNYNDGYHFLLQKELSAEIQEAIDSLPEECRNIFKLSRYEGLKNKEIADVCGVSVRTVETQIYRALKVLKGKLSNYLPLVVFYLSQR